MAKSGGKKIQKYLFFVSKKLGKRFKSRGIFARRLKHETKHCTKKKRQWCTMKLLMRQGPVRCLAL
jgi:hypothetical protein